MTQDLGRYLGVPVLHGRILHRTYQPILDRMYPKLSGWKVSSLSLEGRIMLALSILNAIPAYAMQTSVLPSHICEKIDQKLENLFGVLLTTVEKFTWSPGIPSASQRTAESWVRKVKELNLAYMMKLAYLFFKSPNDLWVQVLQHKYFRDGTNGLVSKNSSRVSPLWKAIKRATPIMELGLRMGLRDGDSTNLWQDRWIDSGESLIDSVVEDQSTIDIDQPVSAFVSASSEWNWPLFSHLLTPDARLQVAGMSPPTPTSGADRITWELERDEKFRIRSAYTLAAEDEAEPREGVWKTIWR
ncbi:Putative ribonuclease H protein At1g65750 [Linum perenne]